MLAEQDNCGTDLPNKTKEGLHSKEDVPVCDQAHESETPSV